MKKLVLSLAVVALGYNAQAQDQEFGFKEGDVILEGNVSFNSSNDKNTDVKENSFNFAPKAGLFVSDKFAVGVQLGIGTDKTKAGSTVTSKQNDMFIGAFGRYYFLELGKRFKTYTEVGLGYASTKTETAGVKNPDVTGFSAGAGLGINYFVTPKIAVNFGLSDVLSYRSGKVKGGENVSEFNGNINVFNNFFDAATFGLTYKF